MEFQTLSYEETVVSLSELFLIPKDFNPKKSKSKKIAIPFQAFAQHQNLKPQRENTDPKLEDLDCNKDNSAAVFNFIFQNELPPDSNIIFYSGFAGKSILLKTKDIKEAFVNKFQKLFGEPIDFNNDMFLFILKKEKTIYYFDHPGIVKKYVW